jgi:hypothetical protein
MGVFINWVHEALYYMKRGIHDDMDSSRFWPVLPSAKLLTCATNHNDKPQLPPRVEAAVAALELPDSPWHDVVTK